ncbi:MAG TPA: sigma-70 family RNA polymerase sigma factor [Pirellulaceae bacterium]|nr:sigma-70 family RNA polymerase sigma factor [Pirellulaceae bacterium]
MSTSHAGPRPVDSGPPADQLIEEIRGGATHRLGELLESYRNYLSLLAVTQVDARIRAKLSPSDLVQETMLGAYRDFGAFQGSNERQLLGWLRQILLNRLHTFVQKNLHAAKRNLRREVSIEDLGAALAKSTAMLEAGGLLADRGPSPSAEAIRRENAVQLADHLAKMPSDYRDVIVLRNLQKLSFEEIGQRMERSSGAVRMLWLRAIKQLREQMNAPPDDGAVET